MSALGISVVIVGEGKDAGLAATLRSLASQRPPQDVRFEVVVVSCGEPRSLAAGEWPFPLRYVTQPRLLFGYSQRAAARNKGMEAATGEVLVLLAEGLIAADSFLDDHWNYHASGERLGIVGPVPGNHTNGEQDWLWDIAPWALLDGANFSLRKCEMERVGGFDVDLSAYEAGDAEFGYRLWKSGVRILRNTGGNAHWLEPPVEPGSWRGRGMDYIGLKHPELFAIARLWQLEKDVEVRTGLRHSNIYHARMKRLFGQPTPDADHPKGWTLARFFNDGSDPLEDWVNRSAEDQRTTGPAAIFLIAAQPTRPSRTMIALQAKDLPITFLSSTENQEWGEIAYLKFAQRLAKPKIRNDGTEEILAGLDRELVERERALRQRGLSWSRLWARGSVLLIGNKEKGPEQGLQQRLESLQNDRGPNAVARARREWASAPKDHSFYGPLAEGYSYPPRAISFKLTHLCNLRCEMCGQWGPAGNALREDKAGLRTQLTLSELQAIIDQVALDHPGLIYLWGGEPFLHPNFLEFIAYIRRKGLYSLVTTNGTRLAECADEVVAQGLHTLRVSLDGPPEVHDRIRNRPGLFPLVMDGLQAVQAAKKARGSPWPFIEIFCTISPGNYRSLEALVDELEPVGINALNFGHMMHVPQAVGEKHQQLFSELFGVEAKAWRGFAQEVHGIDTGLLIDIVRRLQSRQTPFPIGFEPPLHSLEEIPVYYQDPSLLFPKKHCRGPWQWAEIHPNGDLSFCDEYPDYIVGNVVQDGFLHAWNSERARHFRRQVLAHKRFPICTPCHLLHLVPALQD